MATRIDLLLRGIDEVFNVSGWQIALRAAVDVTAAQAAWSPGPGRNSIWKIVNHLSLWMEDVADSMAGIAPKPKGWAAGVDFREIGSVTDEAWRASVERLAAAHGRLKAELAKRSDADLDAPAPGRSAALSSTILGLIAHDGYHCGQICYIRALQGIPAGY
ncbi:MAG TPA: DinB family protein [bacterium]|nr:DinB family protein [bacterium]